MRSAIRPLAALGSLLGAAIACRPPAPPITRDSQPGSLVDTAVAYQQEDEFCGFQEVRTFWSPADLAYEYVRRDAQGAARDAGAWLDSALACPGHRKEPVGATIVTGFRLTRDDSTEREVTFDLEYDVAGFINANGQFFPNQEAAVGVVRVKRTPWGWRVSGPEPSEDLTPLAAIAFFHLRGEDSLAMERLAGPNPSDLPSPRSTLLLPGDDWRETIVSDGWLGLYEGATGRWTLRSAKVKKATTHDACREADVPIIATEPSGARFLVLADVGLREASGPLFSRTPRFVGPGDSVLIPIAGTHMTIELHGTGKLEETPTGRIVHDYYLGLALVDEEHGYEVEVWHGEYADVAPSVEWIGDLNQDGFPDVLVKIPTEGYGTLIRLLLSDDSGEETIYRTAGEAPILDC